MRSNRFPLRGDRMRDRRLKTTGGSSSAVEPTFPANRCALPGAPNKKGHLFPGALFDSIQNDQATDGASSAVMSITTGSSSGTSTKAFTLMFRCKSKPVPAGMMWPMMTFSLKPRR